MIPGEAGFFYLCFNYNDGLYAQRVDLEGSNYWPTWGSSQVGALLYQMASQFSFWPSGALNMTYKYPFLYGIHSYHRDPDPLIPCYYRINGLDSLGNRIWGDDGVLMSVNDSLCFHESRLVSDNSGGIACVFMEKWGNSYDIAAKHINSDGSVGGHNAPIEDITISIDADDLVLNWSSKAPNADYYIYKSFEPYSFPVTPDTVISDTFFIDVDALSEGMKFYDVRWEPLE